MNVAWYLKRFIFIFIIITKLHTFIDLIILCCSFQDSVSQIFSRKVSFPWNGFVSTVLWRIDRGWSQAEVIETGHGGRWSPMSNSGPIPQSRAQGWPLGTVVRHFEAHWLEHPRWKSVPSRASDRRSSQTWREDRKPPMAHFLVSPFGSVPYEKKQKQKTKPQVLASGLATGCSRPARIQPILGKPLLFPEGVRIPRGRKWAWSLCFRLILYSLDRKK